MDIYELLLKGLWRDHGQIVVPASYRLPEPKKRLAEAGGGVSDSGSSVNLGGGRPRL